MVEVPSHEERTGGKSDPGGHHYDVIVMAASAGGVNAMGSILAALPASLPVPIAIVQHRTSQRPFLLAQVLGRRTSLHVNVATEGEEMKPGNVYVAPPDRHLTINADHTLACTDGRRIKHVLSSADPTPPTAFSESRPPEGPSSRSAPMLLKLLNVMPDHSMADETIGASAIRVAPGRSAQRAGTVGNACPSHGNRRHARSESEQEDTR